MKKTKAIIDLKPYNYNYTDNGLMYQLLNLKKETMRLEVAVFQNEQFLKNETKPFAQIPKKLKSKINPL